MRIMKMMMVSTIAISSILLLTSCGNATALDKTNTKYGDMTPEELREELITETNQEEQMDLYEALNLCDEMSVEELTELAKLYEAKGETEKQRDILIRIHKMDPSDEHAAAISLIWKNIDSENEGENEDILNLVTVLLSDLENGDVTALKELTGDEEFQSVFSDGLYGVDTKTKYENGDTCLKVQAGSWETIFTYDTNSNSCAFAINDSQITFFQENENGFFQMDVYDTELNHLSQINGTLDEDICEGDLTVVKDGQTFWGSFDSGKPTATQYEEVSSQGYVIYAYDEKLEHYLYTEGDMETFVMTTKNLGIPSIE